MADVIVYPVVPPSILVGPSVASPVVSVTSGPAGPTGPTGATGSNQVAMSISGNLVVGHGVQPFIVTRASTILHAIAAAGQAPTGSSVIFDVLRNGVSVFTTTANRPTVPAGQTVGALTVPDVTALAVGDVLTVDVIQVGSTFPGANATLVVEIG